jgi:hypothetical protein
MLAPQQNTYDKVITVYFNTAPPHRTPSLRLQNVAGWILAVAGFLGAVFRIHNILVWIRIRRSMPLTNGSGSADPCLWLIDPVSDPSIFVIDLQDASKKLIFSACYFLKVHSHYFSMKKSQKKSQNSMIQVFSYYFCMMKDPDPEPELGGQKTRGSGGSGTLLGRMATRSGRCRRHWVGTGVALQASGPKRWSPASDPLGRWRSSPLWPPPGTGQHMGPPKGSAGRQHAHTRAPLAGS